jgi:hypothetical protein
MTTLPFASPADLYLLVGQSNMAGRGRVSAAVVGPHPRVFAWSRNDAWVPAVDPLHWDKPEAGVGPGLAFAAALAEAEPQRVIGLIPAAVGGTAISLWTPGTQDPVTKAYPYDDALRRTRLALPAGRLAGIIWHQGEGDRGDASRPLYGERLIALVARLRADLGAPDVPFVAGELAQLDPDNHRATAEMNRTLNGLRERIPRFACVSAAGLCDGGDHLHLDSASAAELGRRYAVALRGLIAGAAAVG